MENLFFDIPNAFWKYYDLFRRKKITLEDFSTLSGLPKEEIRDFLKLLFESKEKW